MLEGRSGLLGQMYQLLRAHLLLRRDVDYVVDDGRVVLVDRETGRPRPDSHYRDGMQSAVEAEGGFGRSSRPSKSGRSWGCPGWCGSMLMCAV